MVLLAGSCGGALGQPAVVGAGTIELRLDRPRVPADGKTRSQIRARVRNAQGQPVPDGTQVMFHIEGGHLSEGQEPPRTSLPVSTVGGYARAYATSTQVGRATVTATAPMLATSAKRYLYFAEEGAAIEAAPRVLTVRGPWVGYAIDLNVVEAQGDTHTVFGPLRIDAADSVQVDVNRLTVKARGLQSGVTATAGDASLSGEDLYYDLGSEWGAIKSLTDAGLQQVFFDGYTLEKIEPPGELPQDAFSAAAAETDAWAVARSISVFPYEKLVLRHASVYAGAKRLMKLPKYWVVGMPGYAGTTHSQMVGLNSSGGIAIDFPFFYRVTDDRTGAVKVQRGATGASVVARNEWSLALEEAYDTGDVEGAVTIAGLPREDWGIEWRDSRTLWGGNEGHFNVYSPDHESLFADADVYEWAADHRLSLRAHFERPASQDESYGASADWLTHSRRLGRWNASYRLGTAVGARHKAEHDRGVVGEHQVYAALDLPRRHLDRRTSLTPSFSSLLAWDTGGYRYQSLRGELRLRRIFSSSLSVQVSYEPQFTSGDYSRGLEHVFGLDTRWYHGGRWHSYLNGTYELPDGDAYAYWLLDYYLNRDWRVGFGALYYDYSEGSYDDFQITVGRLVGGREIGLRWSQESDTISLELGGFGTF